MSVSAQGIVRNVNGKEIPEPTTPYVKFDRVLERDTAIGNLVTDETELENGFSYSTNDVVKLERATLEEITFFGILRDIGEKLGDCLENVKEAAQSVLRSLDQTREYEKCSIDVDNDESLHWL